MVGAQSPGEQPLAVLDRALAIEAGDRGLAPGDAVAGEGAVDDPEEFVFVAVGVTGVGPDLPLQAGGPAAQGAVEAVAGGRRLVLVVGRSRRRPVGGDRHGGVLQIAVAHPALDAEAQVAGRGSATQGQAGRLAFGARIGPHQAGPMFLIETGDMKRDAGVADGPGQPPAQVPVLFGEGLVSGPAMLAHRDVAAGPPRRAADQDIDAAGAGLEDRGAAAGLQRAPAHVDLHAFPGPLMQIDDAGQRPGPIGSGSAPADDIDAVIEFGRQPRPDHPAAERVVLRHAVDRQQGSSGAGRGDRAQRDALRGRVGRGAGVAAEERDARRLAQRLVDPGASLHIGGVHDDHREGGVGGGGRQPRHDHLDWGDDGRDVIHGSVRSLWAAGRKGEGRGGGADETCRTPRHQLSSPWRSADYLPSILNASSTPTGRPPMPAASCAPDIT